MTHIAQLLLNGALYQTGWFCCILGAAWGYPWLGALGSIFLAGIHLALVRSRKNELLFMLAAGVGGFLLDSVNQWLEVLLFSSGKIASWLAPVWIFSLWFQFATLFRMVLAWLSGRYVISAVFGAIGGPLAYWAGVELGAAKFSNNILYSLSLLSLEWLIAMPILVGISEKIGGTGKATGYRLFK
jgi:hypothetical protein